MQVVVITGSTRGIGYGLARSFLARDCAVVISSRGQEAVDAALTELRRDHPPKHVCGLTCDVIEPEQVIALWQAAVDRFGHVDCWINNAGMTHRRVPVHELTPAERHQVIDVNLIGAINGCAVAIPAMLEQGFGAVYNMEGLGSDGRIAVGSVLYGATKRAIAYLSKGLAQEVADTPIIVGTTSPGMVMTDLLTGGHDTSSPEWERTKRMFNILADRVETVTPWLADQVLKNEKNGAQLAWLTPRKIMWRFVTSPFNKRDLFTD